MRHFYTEKCIGGDFTMTGAEHNHLANVLRCSVGEIITIVRGDQYNYTYRIKSIKRTETELEFVKKTKNMCNPTRPLTVFMAIVKMDNTSLVVQKLTELGATELVLFKSARCVINPLLVNIIRLEKIAQQSCKQCGRSIPMKIRGVISFEQLLAQLGRHKAFFADEVTRDIPHLHFFSYTSTENAALVIGPEGGFTKPERVLLHKCSIPITLGRRILRVETAVLAGASIMLAHMGEL